MKKGHERSAADVERALGRYRELVEDWPAFVRASLRPLPPVVWGHPGRIESASLGPMLAGSQPIAWTPGSFRWPVERPGRHWAHAAGLFFVQEEASQLPVRLLDLRPGLRVLDLCAAPGGKTARMALALQGTGTVVANDRKPARQVATAATVARLGLTNVVLTARDGTTFEDRPIHEGGGFDRVLVDAPCTAEGNLSGRLRRRPVEAGYRRFINDVQRALLRRAVQLCRPGGRIVYSTCTYAPEENEAVVDAIVAEGGVELAEVAVDGLATTPGATAGGTTTGLRLWPHRAGTGGFFAAALNKPGERRSTVSRWDNAPGLASRWASVAQRHGLDVGLPLRASGGSIWLVGQTVEPPPGELISAGVCLVRRPERSAKLTTEGAMVLGRRAVEQWVTLTADQVVPYQSRQSVSLSSSQSEHATRGQVVVRFGAHALGMGTLRDGQLESAFPKAWAWDPARPPASA